MAAIRLAPAWLSLIAWAVAGVLAAVWGYRETVRYEDQGLPLTLIAGGALFLFIELIVVVGVWALATLSRRPRRRSVAIGIHLVLLGLGALAWGVVEPSGAVGTVSLVALTGLSFAGAVTVMVSGRTASSERG